MGASAGKTYVNWKLYNLYVYHSKRQIARHKASLFVRHSVTPCTAVHYTHKLVACIRFNFAVVLKSE